MIRKQFFYILLAVFIFTITSCFEKEETDFFERQADDKSIDLMQVGDDISYFGNDTPRAGIFIINSRANFLKAFGIKLEKFQEMDKTRSELDKLINTEPIYQMEVYELPVTENINLNDSKICGLITEKFYNAKLLYKLKNISFRVKERDWIELNLKINPNSLIFVRLGIGDAFSTIDNRAVDSLFIKAKKNNQSSINKNKYMNWSCQEFVFREEKTFEPSFYNPDVVFYLSK